MAKKMKARKKQLIALISAAIVSVTAFSVYLFKDELLSLFKSEQQKQMEEAGWEKETNLGDIETTDDSSVNEEQENILLEDSLGNKYELKTIPAIRIETPVPLDDNWSLSLMNDVLYYNYLEEGEYNNIQIAVVPLKYSKESVYTYVSHLTERLSHSLIYRSSGQYYRCIRMMQNNLISDPDAAEEYQEYYPQVTFRSLRNTTQYYTPYCDYYYINKNGYQYAVVGVGENSKSHEINELTHMITSYLQHTSIPEPTLKHLTQKVDLVDGTIKIPQYAFGLVEQRCVYGVLSQDAYDIEAGIAFYVGYLPKAKTELPQETQDAFKKAYLQYIGNNITDVQSDFVDYCKFSSRLIESTTSESGGTTQRCDILYEGNSEYVYKQSALAPLQAICIRSPLNANYDRVAITIYSGQNKDVATRYAEALLGNIS